MEGDVECLAVLTGLRKLCLRGSCACHGGDENDPSRSPENPRDWSVYACNFDGLECQGKFLRLLPLAGLKVLKVAGPWEVLQGFAFRAGVNALRSGAGG